MIANNIALFPRGLQNAFELAVAFSPQDIHHLRTTVSIVATGVLCDLKTRCGGEKSSFTGWMQCGLSWQLENLVVSDP